MQFSGKKQMTAPIKTMSNLIWGLVRVPLCCVVPGEDFKACSPKIWSAWAEALSEWPASAVVFLLIACSWSSLTVPVVPEEAVGPRRCRAHLDRHSSCSDSSSSARYWSKDFWISWSGHHRSTASYTIQREGMRRVLSRTSNLFVRQSGEYFKWKIDETNMSASDEVLSYLAGDTIYFYSFMDFQLQ